MLWIIYVFGLLHFLGGIFEPWPAGMPREYNAIALGLWVGIPLLDEAIGRWRRRRTLRERPGLIVLIFRRRH